MAEPSFHSSSNPLKPTARRKPASPVELEETIRVLTEELCNAYRRIVLREAQLADALERIAYLESIEPRGDRDKPMRSSRVGAEGDPSSKQTMNEVEVEPLPRQEHHPITKLMMESNENMTEDSFFQVTIRPAPTISRPSREPRFVDENTMDNRQLRPGASWSTGRIKKAENESEFGSIKPQAKSAEKMDTTTPRSRGPESARRAAARTLLSAHPPPPPPPPSIMKETRPPFVPASREGQSLFNIHSIRQRKERERIIDEPARIRHRPVIQQPPRDYR